MSKKVIFGGSFNPVTLGHGTVISRLEEAGFQEIILLPCFDHFHGKELELSKIRLEMCRRMFRNWKGVRVSNFEIKNQLTGATIDLIQAWLDHYGEVEDLFFLIGTDNANYFHNWKSWRELQSLVSFLVMERPGEPLLESGKWCLQEPHLWLPIKRSYNQVLSSSLFRDKMKKELFSGACKLVSPKVWNFIKKQGLYQLND